MVNGQPARLGIDQRLSGGTGVPVILNTSFNENEPIVCTPDEAVSCLLRTKMDALAITQWAHGAIGNFLVEKEVGLAG